MLRIEYDGVIKQTGKCIQISRAVRTTVIILCRNGYLENAGSLIIVIHTIFL